MGRWDVRTSVKEFLGGRMKKKCKKECSCKQSLYIVGWICPKCDAGLSPLIVSCPYCDKIKKSAKSLTFKD